MSSQPSAQVAPDAVYRCRPPRSPRSAPSRRRPTRRAGRGRARRPRCRPRRARGARRSRFGSRRRRLRRSARPPPSRALRAIRADPVAAHRRSSREIMAAMRNMCPTLAPSLWMASGTRSDARTQGRLAAGCWLLAAGS